MPFMKRDKDAIPRNCYECHFLCIRALFSASLGDQIPLEPERRPKLLDGTLFDQCDPKYTHIGCALGRRWLYKSGKEHLDKLKEAILKPRGDSCRWLRNSPGVSFAVAADDEERMAYRREAEDDRKWAKAGVWVAAIALVANLLWNVTWSLWEHYNPPKRAPWEAATPATRPAEPSSP